MATSKTLTPTNVTIQIPAFADKPDQRVNSNCIDKEADAINALSDQIANLFKSGNLGSTSPDNTVTVTPVTGGAHIIVLARTGANRSVLAVYDYFSTGYAVIGGSVPSGITITKNANSHNVTIENGTGGAIGWLVI